MKEQDRARLMEELEAGKISGVPVHEAEVYKRLGVNEEYITQKSRACGENPQVSALFVVNLSAYLGRV